MARFESMGDVPDYFRVDVTDMQILPLNAALEVWRSKCPEGDVPIWGDLHFLDFDAEVLPNIMLLDVDGGTGFGSYRYWGSLVASANAKDMTGLRVSDLVPPRHAAYSVRQYRWIVENARPALFVACLGEKSWDRKYEAVLRMPRRSAVDSGIDRVLSVGFYEDAREAIESMIDADIDLENYFDPDADKAPLLEG